MSHIIGFYEVENLFAVGQGKRAVLVELTEMRHDGGALLLKGHGIEIIGGFHPPLILTRSAEVEVDGTDFFERIGTEAAQGVKDEIDAPFFGEDRAAGVHQMSRIQKEEPVLELEAVGKT